MNRSRSGPGLRTAVPWMLPLMVLAAAAVGAAPDPPSVPVGSEACAACHEAAVEGMKNQIHMRLKGWEIQGREVGCEGCHGPGSAHVEAGGDTALVRRFAVGDDSYEAGCLDCHATSDHIREWKGSAHAREGVGCESCHTVHQATMPLDNCRQCHADVLASFQLPSHHPVREGQMTCASCHNVHTASPGQLLDGDQRLNDTCYRCHQDKEGPFVFEHPPVHESCATCHQPHGSVANNLLTVGEPALCLQCHEFHFHTGYAPPADAEVDVGGIRRENPWGREGMVVAFSSKCTECHSRVHGTDLPSQGVPSSGKGLVR